MTDHILNYWDSQAETHGASHWASWGDHWMIQLEVDAISAWLPLAGNVLDAGCANGHATRILSGLSPAARFIGVDFSPKMIREAESHADVGDQAVEYRVADVRELPFDDATFALTYTTRTLINLPTWDDQLRAIDELVRVTHTSGRVLLSEAFWEPLCSLNSLRMLADLQPLEEHDFNRYLKLHRLRQALEERGLSHEIIAFSSLYYLGSRFVREVSTDTSAFPGYSNPVNEAFFDLERIWSGGPFSVQSLVVINV